MSTAEPLAQIRARPRRGTAASRPAWWSQVALIVVGLWLYDEINNLNPVRHTIAMAHAHGILRVERILRIDPELSANQWLSGHLSLGRVLGSWYDMAHFGVTIALLAWVFVRHPGPYRFLRNALIGINGIGFLVFWAWPLAPPRLVPGAGYIDIVAVTNAIGVGTSGSGSPHANELAAMPSLHTAYAAWCVLAVWSLRKAWLPRTAIGVHLAMTVVVVLATGNHYTLDVVAGVATAAVAAGAGVLIARRLDQPIRQRDADLTSGESGASREFGESGTEEVGRLVFIDEPLDLGAEIGEPVEASGCRTD